MVSFRFFALACALVLISFTFLAECTIKRNASENLLKENNVFKRLMPVPPCACCSGQCCVPESCREQALCCSSSN